MIRFVVTVVAIFALTNPLVSVSVSSAGGVGDYCCEDCYTNKTLCNTGLSCCYTRPGWLEDEGGTCYDPAVSTCAYCPVYNPNHPQTQLCPNASPTCCGGCINNTTQCCHQYGTYDFHQCNADQICCGFYHGQHTCCSNNQLCINDVCVPKPTCPSGYLLCGAACYNPSQYVCVTQSVCHQEPTEYVCESHSILCPVANPSLCGDACYNEQQYTCVNGVLTPVQSGGNPTGGPTQAPTQAPTQGATSGPTTSSTPAPGCVLPGDLKCGTRCYSPVTHVCANPGSSFLCPVSFPSLCGENACYNQAQYTCVNGQLVPASNPTQGPTQGPTTGPTSSTPAPGCVLPGDLKCSTRCYSPTTHVCADPGSSFLCPVAFPSLCGADACYSNSQYTCVNGHLQPK